MGAEQSQMSQEDAQLSHTQDEVFNPDAITSDSNSDRQAKEEIPNQDFPPATLQSSPIVQQTTPSTNKKKKKSRRKSRKASSLKRNSSLMSETVSEHTPVPSRSTAAVQKVEGERKTPEHTTVEESGQASDNDNNGDGDDSVTFPQVQMGSGIIEDTAAGGGLSFKREEQLMGDVPISETSIESSQKLPPMKVNSRLKYACPKADTHNCTERFALISAARRHAEIAHFKTGQFGCSVCSKQFKTASGLRKHELKHKTTEAIPDETEVAVPGSEGARNEIRTDVSDIEDSQLVGQELEEDDSQQQQINPLPFKSPRKLTFSHINDLHVQAEPYAEADGQENLREDLNSEPQHPSQNQQVAQTTEASDHLSSNSSIEPGSVFDEAVNTTLTGPSVTSGHGVKRKRDMPSGQSTTNSDTAPKRRRRDILSPPTSLTSEDLHDEHEVNHIETGSRTSRKTNPESFRAKPQTTKLGNLDKFAKPWAPGSQLYHPIHNPRSPRRTNVQQIEVMVPQTSRAGPSTAPLSQNLKTARKLELSSFTDQQTPLAGKTRKSVYSSPKGKRKAEPGIDYSSPEKAKRVSSPNDKNTPSGQESSDKRHIQRRVNEQDALSEGDGDDIVENSNSKQSSRGGLATSIARRTTSQQGSKKVASSRKKRKATEAESGQSSSGSESGPDDDDGSDGEIYLCQECHRKFKSLAALKRHETKKNVHDKLHQCEDCSINFTSIEKLVRHQQDTGHGDGTGYQGRKGHLSPGEISKLKRWRDNFCDEYDLNVSDFNQMMVDTSRRTKGYIWPHRFITKDDFLREYHDVLPNRNRRSMHRYRERAFQNVPQQQPWTQEDDDELTRLYKELGPKWVEIGQRMTRTQDSVNQRWRHKLQYRGKAIDGEWLQADTEQLIRAVNLVKRESDLPLDANTDVKIPWESVSKKLKFKRTAQQCSNKWRTMNMVKKNGRWVTPSDSDRVARTPGSIRTPSKMSQRLAEETPAKKSSKPVSSSAKRKFISEERVEESDEDEKIQDEAEAGNTVKEEGSHDSAHHQPDTARKPAKAMRVRRDMVKQTPIPPRPTEQVRTPLSKTSLSQLFDQTQANTSAPRATTTTRKHTQTERPSPDVPVQMRPSSSPLQTIGATETQKEAEIEADDVDMSDALEEEANTSEDDSLAESAMDDGEAVDAMSSEEEPEQQETSTSQVESSSSSDPSEDEQEVDSGEDDMNKNAFLQSLRSHRSSQSPATQASGTQSRKIDWMRAMQGHGRQSSRNDDTDSSDDDEGDIMHH